MRSRRGFQRASRLALPVLAAFVSVASAQFDRELGITLKKNLPPTGQKVLDDAINTMSERGAVAVLAGPAENYNAQLDGSYGFSVHGTVANTGLQFVNPAWAEASTFPTSYVGVMTLDRTGRVTRYRLTVGETFGRGLFRVPAGRSFATRPTRSSSSAEPFPSRATARAPSPWGKTTSTPL